ncbi:DUF58 domain-containing protein [Oleiharenicola lentus]|uniref:DUF58 domain-containing protein n=1 Tax=Oleiharenicola lentus TaxID=2508720 RepID=UPI003F67116E
MIPKKYLQNIRRLEIRTKRLAEDYLSGAYRSVFKGRGLDFEDVRAYSAGDDVRFIDWNVTARMQTPYVREFQEERELSVVIAVDISASGKMNTAAQTKRELAAEVAACLAFSATSNGDKVGLLLFSDRVETYLPPAKGRMQALRIIRDVLYQPAKSPRTSLRHALGFLSHVQTKRAIVFLISDFLDEGFDRILKATAHRHDLIPILVADPREQTLPDAGWIIVRDVETSELVEVDTGNPTIRTAFAEAARARVDALRHGFRRSGTDLIELKTGEPYLKPLQHYMEKRLSQPLSA